MKTKLTIAVVAIFIIGAAAVFFVGRGSGTVSPLSTAPLTSTATSSAGTSSATSTSYTLADVAEHADATSCWTAINGNVYDVTSWISQHPGGPEHILAICGKDGSSAFDQQHGSEGAPNAELATFKIGTLAQ